MSNEPDSLVLELLRKIRSEIGDVRSEIADTKSELKSDMHSLRADVASDFILMRQEMHQEIGMFRKDVGDQIVGLRRAVVEYHSAVIGHGVLISELEARMRRVEQHLNISDQGTH